VQISSIEATIFYKHEPWEIQALSAATAPMAEHIRAVGLSFERNKTRAILNGEYFRAKDAALMRTMLLRAANHARYHLDDYFPLMRDGIIASTEQLEEAVREYWYEFQRLQNEAIPTN